VITIVAQQTEKLTPTGQKITNEENKQEFEGVEVAINYDGSIIATVNSMNLLYGNVRTYKQDAASNQWNQA
jgi:hypothetical protein